MRALTLLLVPSIALGQSKAAKPAPIVPLKPFTVPAWAIPSAPAPAVVPKPDSTVWHHVPGSPRAYTMKQIGNAFDIPDWFPDEHPRAPTSVLTGRRPNGRACGYCHLPNGAGRPENATLAGLPAAYTLAQVRAFRDSSRKSASKDWAIGSMHAVAAGVTDDDVREAAAYFETLRLTRPNRIVESTTVPKTRVETMLYAKTDEGTEPIAGRLIEVPDEFHRHELRDPTVLYTTYVPPGTVARGRRVVTQGPAGIATACTTCHGPDLLGMAGTPPLAGRSPSSLLRQLVSFRTGARADSASVLMRPIVNALSINDMVAAAAYLGSLPAHKSAKH
ncbi:MAG: c-type cytochrome [Gemmatimonadaceae bacterium]|nr:c-type cytochrome [Gemmatimonadaceae bacterium]